MTEREGVNQRMKCDGKDWSRDVVRERERCSFVIWSVIVCDFALSLSCNISEIHCLSMQKQERDDERKRNETTREEKRDKTLAISCK
jgi:hypothetical protein